MQQQNEREYLELRQRVSAEKARTASDRSVARVHSNFAAHYAMRLGVPAASRDD